MGAALPGARGHVAAGRASTSTAQIRHFPEEAMLRWALIFLVVAIVAAVFGFGGIAAESAGIARILFYIFLIVFLVTLLMHLVSGRRVP
jgi:uncharacterized membrane protein YtjA (UPF0391 family)